MSHTLGGCDDNSDSMCDRAFGKCRTIIAKLGVQVNCLVNSGSEVSTVTEEFFSKHFKPKGQDLISTNGWLTITAANGLEIPYIGYFELDIEVFGRKVSSRGTNTPQLELGNARFQACLARISRRKFPAVTTTVSRKLLIQYG